MSSPNEVIAALRPGHDSLAELVSREQLRIDMGFCPHPSIWRRHLDTGFKVDLNVPEEPVGTLALPPKPGYGW